MRKIKIDSLHLAKAKAIERDTLKSRALQQMKSAAWAPGWRTAGQRGEVEPLLPPEGRDS